MLLGGGSIRLTLSGSWDKICDRAADPQLPVMKELMERTEIVSKEQSETLALFRSEE